MLMVIITFSGYAQTDSDYYIYSSSDPSYLAISSDPPDPKLRIRPDPDTF